MAFTHLKSISSKVNAKVRAQLQSIKRKVLKPKAGETNNAVNCTAPRGINEVAKNNEAVAFHQANAFKTTTIDDTDIIKSTVVESAKHDEPTAVGNSNAVKTKTFGDPDTIQSTVIQSTVIQSTVINSDNGESTITKAPTLAECQGAVISSGPATGASALVHQRMRLLPKPKKAKTVHTRRKVRYSEQGSLVEQNHANEEGDSAGVPAPSTATRKTTKKAKRAARQEARKAKWATRRTAFKAKVKRILDAAVTPGMVALVTVFSPVIMAIGVISFVLDAVVMFIVHALGCLFAPVVICIWWPFD